MKRFTFCMFFIALAGCAAGHQQAGSASPSGEQVGWYTLADGLKAAAAERRPMVVDYYVPKGCTRCGAMFKNVYSVPEIVQRLNKEFIPIHVDLTGTLTRQEKELGERYNFREDCLLLFLTPDGRPVQDSGGQDICTAAAVDAAWFLNRLDLALRASGKE